MNPGLSELALIAVSQSAYPNSLAALSDSPVDPAAYSNILHMPVCMVPGNSAVLPFMAFSPATRPCRLARSPSGARTFFPVSR